MKLLPIPLLLLFSCHQRPAVTTHRDTTATVASDTLQTAKDIATESYPVTYMEDARLERPGEVITMISKVAVVNGVPDSTGQHSALYSYFVHLDKRTGKADTIESGLSEPDGCIHCFAFRDRTDSFGLQPLVVQIITPAEDDVYENTFVGYQDGRFKVLFSIGADWRDKGIELHRQGTKLVGETSGRDELIEGVEQNYPVIVDTKTFEVSNPIPDAQYIGYETTVSEAFRAHRVIAGRIDSSLLAVKTGTKVTLDTFYHSLGQVRLRLPDSAIVVIKAETAKKKLQHNNAG